MAGAVASAMEGPTLPAPVNRIVGGIEVERDPRRRRLAGVEGLVGERRLDGAGVVAGAVAAVGSAARCVEPEPVETGSGARRSGSERERDHACEHELEAEEERRQHTEIGDQRALRLAVDHHTAQEL